MSGTSRFLVCRVRSFLEKYLLIFSFSVFIASPVSNALAEVDEIPDCDWYRPAPTEGLPEVEGWTSEGGATTPGCDEEECERCGGIREQRCIPNHKRCDGEARYKPSGPSAACQFADGRGLVPDISQAAGCNLKPLPSREGHGYCGETQDGECLPSVRDGSRYTGKVPTACGICKSKDENSETWYHCEATATKTVTGINRLEGHTCKWEEVRGRPGYKIDTSECTFEPFLGCSGSCTITVYPPEDCTKPEAPIQSECFEL